MTLRIDELSVRYPDGRQALDRVSLTVGDGETVAVVGGSGSGKSTLVRAVLGLLPSGTIVSGAVRIAGGTDLTSLSGRELRRIRGTEVGYVAQDPYRSVDPWWSVGHHVGEAWRAHRRRAERDELAARVGALGVANPREWLGRRPAAWSGGMLQRADIAAATAHAPRLLVADEPTSALDADISRTVLAALVASSRSLLLVSHDLGLVAQHADRIVVLDEGRVAEALAVGGRGIVDLESSATHAATKDLLRALPGSAPRPSIRRGPPVASLENVGLGYPCGDTVVFGANLQVGAGEVVGLCGPSGAGKSTVLRALTGLLRPVTGTVRHGDAVLWAASGAGDGRPPRPGFVMPIFQDAAASLDPRWPIWKSVAEAVAAVSGRGTRLAAAPVRRQALDLLRQVGLADIDPGVRPGRLSGGQRQRVAIARALGGQARLVVADEPTAALDSVRAADMVGLLRELADRGSALVVVSHDERRLRSFADRVFRVDEGRIRPA